MVITAIASFSFLQFNDEHRRIRSDSGAQADVLNILEAITYDIRNGEIDYEYYRHRQNSDILQTAQDYIVLRNADNDQIRYKIIEATSPDENDAINICVCEASEGTRCNNEHYCDNNYKWRSIHSGQTAINAAGFYVSPDWDPFMSPTNDDDCYSENFDAAVGLCMSPCSADSVEVNGHCELPNVQPRVMLDIVAGRASSTIAVQTLMNTRQYDR